MVWRDCQRDSFLRSLSVLLSPQPYDSSLWPKRSKKILVNFPKSAVNFSSILRNSEHLLSHYIAVLRRLLLDLVGGVTKNPIPFSMTSNETHRYGLGLHA